MKLTYHSVQISACTDARAGEVLHMECRDASVHTRRTGNKITSDVHEESGKSVNARADGDSTVAHGTYIVGYIYPCTIL